MIVTTVNTYAGTATAQNPGLPSPAGPPEAFAPGSLFSSASASMQTEVSRKKKKSDDDQETDSLEKEEVGKLQGGKKPWNHN